MKTALRLLVLMALWVAGCTPARSPAPGEATLPLEITAVPLGTPVSIPLNALAVDEPQLISFQMLSELDGWGITESAVIRTNDGGATWHNVTPPGLKVLGYGVGEVFLDSARAFLLIPDQSDPLHLGTLYRTDNGGESWTSDQAPFGSAEMRFFDMQKGWAMAGLGVATGSNAIAIYQTIDGGKTWEETFTNDPMAEGSTDEIPLGGLKGEFFPLDMETAWVGGVIYSSGIVYLYRTDDGGRHWEPVRLEIPPGSDQAQLSVESIQFVTARDGWLAMQVADNTLVRVLYSTSDGGATWKRLPVVFGNGRSTDFVSETDGFVFDGEQFHVTRDGGQSWAQVEPDVVFSESFMYMDFVNARTGWVTAMDPTTSTIKLYKTTDGGATWTSQ